MAYKLTDTEKDSPSPRLAKNLEYFKSRAEDASKLNECEETCIGQAVAHGGFCIEMAMKHLEVASATHPCLTIAKGYLQSAIAEMKDASFILDGYHAWHKQNTAWEEEASEDLDTCGYAGKWKSAKEGVAREKPDLTGAAYWEAVRTYFLELGGCYLSERCEPAPPDLAAPLLPIIPAMPYQEPQKVRFA